MRAATQNRISYLLPPALFRMKLEHRVEGRIERARNPESEFERGRVFATLDGDDRLPGRADAIGEIGLGEADPLPVFADRVGDAALADDWRLASPTLAPTAADRARWSKGASRPLRQTGS